MSLLPMVAKTHKPLHRIDVNMSFSLSLDLPLETSRDSHDGGSTAHRLPLAPRRPQRTMCSFHAAGSQKNPPRTTAHTHGTHVLTLVCEITFPASLLPCVRSLHEPGDEFDSATMAADRSNGSYAGQIRICSAVSSAYIGPTAVTPPAPSTTDIHMSDSTSSGAAPVMPALEDRPFVSLTREGEERARERERERLGVLASKQGDSRNPHGFECTCLQPFQHVKRLCH